MAIPEVFDAGGQKYFVCFPLVKHSVTSGCIMAMWIIIYQPHEMIVLAMCVWQCVCYLLGDVCSAGQARLY